eukprot:11023-Heterococcus_DN1.PRE.2
MRARSPRRDRSKDRRRDKYERGSDTDSNAEHSSISPALLKKRRRRQLLCIIVGCSAVGTVFLQLGLITGFEMKVGSSRKPGGQPWGLRRQATAQKGIVPRTFEMMTADISDLRGTVTALTDELSSLKRNGYAGAAQDGSSGGNSRGGKSGILNTAGKSAPVVITDVASVSRAINHLNAQIQTLSEDAASTKDLLFAATEALGRKRVAPQQQQQQRLLIVGEPRGGSTLLGTVLNSDEHLFYLFEPCKGGGDAGTALYDEACGYLIQRLLQCEPTVKDVENMFRDWYVTCMYTHIYITNAGYSKQLLTPHQQQYTVTVKAKCFAMSNYCVLQLVPLLIIIYAYSIVVMLST